MLSGWAGREHTHSTEAHTGSRTRDTDSEWRRWTGERLSWQRGGGQNCARLHQSWKKKNTLGHSFKPCTAALDPASPQSPPLASVFNSYLAHLTIIHKHSGLKGATTWISKNKMIKPFWFIKIKDTLKGDTFSTRQQLSPWMIKANYQKCTQSTHFLLCLTRQLRKCMDITITQYCIDTSPERSDLPHTLPSSVLKTLRPLLRIRLSKSQQKYVNLRPKDN